MVSAEISAGALKWERLPSIPDREGFAGSFAGVSRGVILVAGGANFPDKLPWEGGTKVWHDCIFALEPDCTEWRNAGRLPRAGGYGISLTTPEGVLFIGGGDAKSNNTSVIRAYWNGSTAEFEQLPRLPLPLAMSAGVVVDRTVYVMGGLDTPTATKAQSIFLALNLDDLSAGWTRLEPCPGPERFLAVAGSDGIAIYLIGGARLVPGDGKAVREWLHDVWRYTPGKGWNRLADLPRAVVAAPSPAPFVSGRLLVFGGDDGAQINTPPAKHSGFSHDVLAYDPVADRWSVDGKTPFALVTTPAVYWPGNLAIIGGERLPGIRSNEGWSASLVK